MSTWVFELKKLLQASLYYTTGEPQICQIQKGTENKIKGEGQNFEQ